MKCWSAAVLGCCGALVGGGSTVASAQSAEPPTLRVHRVIVSGGVTWSGGYSIGDANASLRTNAIGNAPPPFTLFSTSSTVESVTGVEGRVGYTLTRDLVIETGLAFNKPMVSITIAQDTEVGPQMLAGEELQQYVVDAGATWQLPIRLGHRGRPFVQGGAGYLRQLHQERTLVETGQVYYAGGGLRYWIRGESGATRSLGLRVDARATWKRDGIDYQSRMRMFPSVGVSAFMGF